MFHSIWLKSVFLLLIALNLSKIEPHLSILHMKIKLLVIGKTKKAFLVDGENEYLKRLAKYISFEKTELPDLKNAKNLSESQVKSAEGKLILSKLDKTGLVILLDERGKTHSSLSF